MEFKFAILTNVVDLIAIFDFFCNFLYIFFIPRVLINRKYCSESTIIGTHSNSLMIFTSTKYSNLMVDSAISVGEGNKRATS